jgi:hypothetical protein
VSATALLTEARAAGVRLRLASDGRLKASGAPSLELLDRLRAHKLELAALLRGDICRWCGQPMDWPKPAGIVEGTGTALHHACDEAAEVARIERAGFSAEHRP